MYKWVLGSVLILLLGGAGTVYYYLNVKEYHIEDKEVQEIAESDYDITLPVAEAEPTTDETDVASDDQGESDDEKATNDEKTTGVVKQNDPNEKQSPSAPKPDEPSKPQGDQEEEQQPMQTAQETPAPKPVEKSKPKITAETIKAKYIPTFKQLEEQANAKINALVGKAIQEYQTKKASGEEVSFAYFFKKYKTAGDQMEAKTNATFNRIYDAVVAELEKHGFAASEAEVFREAYNEAKAKRRSALLREALNKLS